MLQGFSVDWWKSKHNTHHAAPNELTHGTREAVDPDIDTLPLIAWSAEMLDGVPEGAMRHMVRSQQYYFFPILMVATPVLGPAVAAACMGPGQGACSLNALHRNTVSYFASCAELSCLWLVGH